MNYYRHANRLLQDIADGLRGYEDGEVKLSSLEVTLYHNERKLLSLSVGQAIDWIVNDVTWDERGDFSAANSAEVVVL